MIVEILYLDGTAQILSCDGINLDIPGVVTLVTDNTVVGAISISSTRSVVMYEEE